MTTLVNFMGIVGGWELIVIILVIVLLFGGRKIPELMKGLGQGLKEFNKARHTDDTDSNKGNSADKSTK